MELQLVQDGVCVGSSSVVLMAAVWSMKRPNKQCVSPSLSTLYKTPGEHGGSIDFKTGLDKQIERPPYQTEEMIYKKKRLSSQLTGSQQTL